MIPPLALALLKRLRLPAIGAVLLLAAYQTGANAERKRGEAADLRVRIETLQTDLDIARSAAERARATSQALADRARTLSERLENAPDADPSCGPYSAADLERLRQLLE